MKMLLFGLIILLTACSSNSNNIEARFKNYMKDTVVTNFNDPASYEFVSIEIDTVFNHDISKKYLIDDSVKLKDQMEKIKADLEGMNEEEKAEYEKHSNSVIEIYTSNIDRYKKELSEPDYVYRVKADIRFRAKNKLGALVINKEDLSYDPKRDKIEINN